ncbi:MAG: hypothetical protein Q9170_004351 [Blastenia crenularia]
MGVNTDSPILDRASVQAAQKRIQQYVYYTPLLTSKTLSDLASTPQSTKALIGTVDEGKTPARPRIRLFFKCENYQRVGAFKSRGAFHALSRFSVEQLSKGVVTHSSGNHAQALALAARTHGVKAYIVMPTISTPSKIAATKGYGAEVIFSGSTSQEREAVVEDVIKRTGATLVPPYDHPNIILGQGTMALEIEEQVQEMIKSDTSLSTHGKSTLKQNHQLATNGTFQNGSVPINESHAGHLDAVIAPLGGGGMLAGIATALNGTGTRVFGAEPSFEGADDGRRGLAASQRITMVKTLTIADGLRTPVGEINWTVISDKSKVKGVFAVGEEQILSAMRLVIERMKVFVEPSAVVGLAVCLYDEGFRRIVESEGGEEGWDIGVILSGGNTTLEAISRLFATDSRKGERAEAKSLNRRAMSDEDGSRSSTESQRLLHSSSFAIDDLEAAGQRNKYTNGSANGQSRWKKSLKQSPPWARPRFIWIALAVAAVLILGSLMILQKSNIVEQLRPSLEDYDVPPPPSPPPPPGLDVDKFEKPVDFKIIGLIFFGRPPVVAILDCYLKKNLVTNGGFLDEVHFVVNTDKKDDIKYLDGLVKTSDLYKKIELPELGYNSVWQHAVEPEHMYIKIDDDMVFFDDEAVANVVYTKLKHPHAFNVVANLVNSPETGWLHYHFGAIHSYLPETSPPVVKPDGAALGPKAWRASALPVWNETGEMSFPVTMDKSDDGSVLEADRPEAPPFKGHRWLPLPEPEKNIYNTPISKSEYNPYSPDWKSWALAAQVHYSLLENIEKNQLRLYHYGTSSPSSHEGLWDMAFGRMNINFMAIWGKDVLDNAPFEGPDDEHELSVNIPIKLNRPVLVNTHAVAAHFSFRTQHEVYETDLLDRYRAYANEMVCTKDNQIPIPKQG